MVHQLKSTLACGAGRVKLIETARVRPLQPAVLVANVASEHCELSLGWPATDSDCAVAGHFQQG